MRSLLFSFILLISSHYAFAADTGKITGKVIDKNTGEPLVGVNILLENTGYKTTTDFDGDYEFFNIPSGVYSLVSTYFGYDTVHIQINITLNKTVVQNFSMKNMEGEQIFEITLIDEGHLDAIKPSSPIITETSRSIIGKVFDIESGKPLIGTKLLLKNTTFEGIALWIDASFTLSDIPAGTYNLIATFEGYAAQNIVITVIPNKIIEQNIKLEKTKSLRE